MKLAAIIIAGAFIVGACLFFAARAAEHGSVSVAALAGVVAFVTFAATKALAGAENARRRARKQARLRPFKHRTYDHQ